MRQRAAADFFGAADNAAYRNLLSQHSAAHGVAIWCRVLMPNHVHLILVPQHPDALRAALSKVHRAYAGRSHARERRTGHFWQGRFGCEAMDELHLLAALRYVALNPVRAGLAAQAENWRWPSVHALLNPVRGDGLTDTGPVLERVPHFNALLRSGERASPTPCAAPKASAARSAPSEFLDRIDAILECDPKPRKRRPKQKELSALSP